MRSKIQAALQAEMVQVEDMQVGSRAACGVWCVLAAAGSVAVIACPARHHPAPCAFTLPVRQGDGRHVEIVVVSKEFEGKSAVNRQRMVYKVRAAAAAVHCSWTPLRQQDVPLALQATAAP